MKLKKILINTSICFAMLSMLSVSSLPYYATEVSTQNTNATTTGTAEENSGGWIPDEYERLGAASDSDLFGLPSFYDPRDESFLTESKDQYFTDLCWLFAAAGAIEQKTSKSYGSKFDLSEAHAAVALSNYIIPESFNGNGVYYDHAPDTGGNSARALQYFTNWNTPIFNNETYQWNATVSENSYSIFKILNNDPINSDFTNATSLLNVTGAEYVNNNINDIKRAILTNGAVVTAVDVSTSSYMGTDSNNELNYYRGPNYMPATHAVALVGWNDNYSRDNFVDSKPSSDGAWLVRNSYNGKQYFWLSYEEGSIEDNFLTITGVEKTSTSERMLSYDYYPVGYTDSSFNDVVYLCNVFDVSTYTDTYDEINKVMFYLRTTGCTYNIKIVQLDDNGTLPLEVDSYSSLATGEFSGEGYLTANLDTPYSFVSDNKCAVIIKLTPKSENSEIYIPFEGEFKNSNEVYLSPEINNGESYFGFINNQNQVSWNDCCSENQYNIAGNLVIRPVLKNSNAEQNDVNITPTRISDENTDVNIQINADIALFNIHTASNYVLRQDVDYVRTNTGITLKSSFINSLDGAYTELILEFSNDIAKSVVVNPKSVISDVTVTGKPIIGDTLTANCIGEPEKSQYDVNYQWQSSTNGENWYNISGANSNTYTITDNDIDRYIRVKVTAKQFGNVEYPTEKFSSSTIYKAVILGDVNLDGTVKVADATLLGKYLADIVTLDGRQLLAADANRDNYVDVNDVRAIQQLAM